MKFSMAGGDGPEGPPVEAPDDAEIDDMVAFLVSVVKSLFANEEDNYRVAVAHRKPAPVHDKGKRWWKVSLRFFVVGLWTRKDRLKIVVKNLNARWRDVMESAVVPAKLKSYVTGEIFDGGVYDDNRKMNCLTKSKTVADKRYLLPYGHDDVTDQDFSDCLIQNVADATEQVRFVAGSFKTKKRAASSVTSRPSKKLKTEADEEQPPVFEAVVDQSDDVIDAGPVPEKLRWFLSLRGIVDDDLKQNMKYFPSTRKINIPTTSLFCPIVRRNHKSNHAYFVVTLCPSSEEGGTAATIQRRCHDCKDESAKRCPIEPLDEESIGELKDVLEALGDSKTAAAIEAGMADVKKIIDVDCGGGNENVVVERTNPTSPDVIYTAMIESLLNNKGCLKCGSKLRFELGTKGYRVMCTNPDCDWAHPGGGGRVSVSPGTYPSLSIVINLVQNNNIQNNNFYGGGDRTVSVTTQSYLRDNLKMHDDPDVNFLFVDALYGTDVRIARVFHRLHADDFVWSGSKIWHAFDGDRWKRIPEEDMRLLFHDREFTGPFIAALECYARKDDSPEVRTKMAKIDRLVKRLESSGDQIKILAQLEILHRRPCAEFLDKLDSDKNLVGFDNGVYDCKEGAFRQGRREDLVSVSVGYSYDEAKMKDPAIRESVDRFLSTVFPDRELKEYVLTFLASCFTGFTKDQLIHIGHGGGANGKSLLMTLMSLALGGYAGKMESAFICGKTPDADTPTPTLSSLVGKRFVYVSEVVAGAKLNEQLFKTLCGEDKMTYRPLYAESRFFVPEFKMFMVVNDLPSFNGSDYAMIRRLRVIPFVSTFVDDDSALSEANHVYKKDATLVEKLPEWKEAFAGMLLDSLKDYRTKGLSVIPEMIERSTATYKSENDVFQTFIDEELVTLSGSNIVAKDVYDAFRSWALRTGQRLRLTSDAFLGKMFNKTPLKRRRVGTNYRFVDVEFRTGFSRG